MFSIVKPGTKIDFIGKSPLFLKVTLFSFVAAVVALFTPGIGLKLGLDFTGGYAIVLAFDKPVTATQVRDGLRALDLGESSVQAYDNPESKRTHFLVRIQRATVLKTEEIATISKAFESRYGAQFKGPIGYNPDVGNTIEVGFAPTSTSVAALATAVDTSSAALMEVLKTTQHEVRRIKKVGRPDENRYAVTLAGIDLTVLEAFRRTIDASVTAESVDYVGPTVGRQLRDDGILAIFYALLLMLVYVALRFDFFFGPGAIACVFHDAIITTGLLAILGRDFNLTTIAGLLTLIGYSINDTIIVYDRIRETIGKAQGAAMKDILNRAVNETLSRTIMTSFTVFTSAVCLMIFGRNTALFDYGLIMAFGVVIGTYSSVYVAAPIFMALRLRFGPKEQMTPTAGRAKVTAQQQT